MIQVFIILDKMDKIGLDGVAAELEESGFAKESIEKYIDLFDKISDGIDGVLYCKEKLEGFLAPEIADNMTTIIESVLEAKTANFEIKFDPTPGSWNVLLYRTYLSKSVLTVLPEA